jgi:hypothetical protein
MSTRQKLNWKSKIRQYGDSLEIGFTTAYKHLKKIERYKFLLKSVD